MSTIRGRVWVLGNDIDTDVLAPGLYMKGPLEELARHCLEAVNPDFASSVELGDVILAGQNFGVGSSREQAAQVLTILGIKAIVAESFGGIFYRNALNVGLLAIVAREDLQAVTGDIVRIDPVNGVLSNESNSEFVTCDPVPDHLMAIVNAGGLVPHLKIRLEAKRNVS